MIQWGRTAHTPALSDLVLALFPAALISVKNEQLEFSQTDKIMRAGVFTTPNFSQPENYPVDNFPSHPNFRPTLTFLDGRNLFLPRVLEPTARAGKWPLLGRPRHDPRVTLTTLTVTLNMRVMGRGVRSWTDPRPAKNDPHEPPRDL